MQNDATTRWTVSEVHNFGGFFGGDTVTLTASSWDDQAEETITIDERALVDIADRHKVAPAMVFDLLMAGERVERAQLVGAREWPILASALELHASPAPLLAPLVRAYHCERCELWVLGEPLPRETGHCCRLCGQPL